jgi:trk system potassium uptake protein TrkH
MFLIVVGGIGFIAIHEITHSSKRSKNKFSLHTKTVIITSLFLIGLGFLTILFFEFDGVLLKYSLSGKLWASLFQSVTTRTAGFNTLPIESLTSVTLTIMILFMFIGASPGSTGGGIKTTTFAVLLLSVKSVFKGEGSVKADRRTIPVASIIKALALLVSALILVSIVFLLLLFIEDKPYLSLLFETISAFGTVGLSTGITPDLTIQGKLLITLLMYIGRIGPLTMGLALTKEIMKEKIEYPETRVLIG